MEDSDTKTDTVRDVLEHSGIPYTHLAISTPKEEQAQEGMERFQYHRGVDQRNLALKTVAAMTDTNAVVCACGEDVGMMAQHPLFFGSRNRKVRSSSSPWAGEATRCCLHNGHDVFIRQPVLCPSRRNPHHA